MGESIEGSEQRTNRRECSVVGSGRVSVGRIVNTRCRSRFSAHSALQFSRIELLVESVSRSACMHACVRLNVRTCVCLLLWCTRSGRVCMCAGRNTLLRDLDSGCRDYYSHRLVCPSIARSHQMHVSRVSRSRSNTRDCCRAV